MKQILIISGKGGTGKTVLTASFAVLAKNKIMVDCDVDAADLFLILHPKIVERHDFRSGSTALIDQQICSKCGVCKDACRFDAVTNINNFVVDPIFCEGCGLCARVCPERAIQMQENLSGEWFISDTLYGTLVHSKLGIAEENSGKLVSKVRQIAKELAEKENRDYVIIDGPPGIGCPVIASLTGVDFAVVVTEPTVSGIHDMKRVLQVINNFKVKCGVVVNKYDLNEEFTKKIKIFCEENNVIFLDKIPFSKEVSKSIVSGIPAVSFCKDGTEKKIVQLWQKIESYI